MTSLSHLSKLARKQEKAKVYLTTARLLKEMGHPKKAAVWAKKAKEVMQ